MNTVVILALEDVSLNDLGYGKVSRGTSLRIDAYHAERSRDLALARFTGKIKVKSDDEPKETRQVGEVRVLRPVPFPTPLSQPNPKIIIPPTPVSAELLQSLLGQIQTLTGTVQELKNEIHSLKSGGPVLSMEVPRSSGQESEEVFIPSLDTGVQKKIALPAEHLPGSSVDEASNTLRTTRKKKGSAHG